MFYRIAAVVYIMFNCTEMAELPTGGQPVLLSPIHSTLHFDAPY